MNIFNNKSLLIALALFAVACNEPATGNDGSMMDPDGSVSMMDGMVPEVDAGMDSGTTVVDAGPKNVNQCNTNNGGCSIGRVCTDHIDPTPVSCGNCVNGFYDNGTACVVIPTWLCAMNKTGIGLGDPPSCDAGHEFVSNQSAASIFGAPYIPSNVNDIVQNQSAYRACVYTQVAAPANFYCVQLP